MTYEWTQKGRGIPSYQYQTSCDGKDGTYGNARTSLGLNNVTASDAGEYHLSYINKDIGPANPPLICIVNVKSKFFKFVKLKYDFMYDLILINIILI